MKHIDPDSSQDKGVKLSDVELNAIAGGGFLDPPVKRTCPQCSGRDITEHVSFLMRTGETWRRTVCDNCGYVFEESFTKE